MGARQPLLRQLRFRRTVKPGLSATSTCLPPPYCYDNLEANCRQYGRLYTWESAQRACRSLGGGWRLPTNEEWCDLARHYGGLLEESEKAGKTAYQALRTGGNSGFDVELDGGRDVDGRYARLGAHGFYWSASDTDAAHAWLYNFGKGMLALNRRSDVDKQRGSSVRCVRE